MKKKSKFSPILVLLFLVGCASGVKTKNFTDTDLTSFKTFAYLPNTNFKANEFNSALDKSVEESLITSMNAKMMEKGFSVDSENPDLLILLSTSNQLNSTENTNYESNDQTPTVGTSASGPNYASVSSSGYQRYTGGGSDATSDKPYKNGTLIVEVFNTKSKELVWLGVAKDFQTHIADQTLMTSLINEIFKKFPG